MERNGDDLFGDDVVSATHYEFYAVERDSTFLADDAEERWIQLGKDVAEYSLAGAAYEAETYGATVAVIERRGRTYSVLTRLAGLRLRQNAQDTERNSMPD